MASLRVEYTPVLPITAQPPHFPTDRSHVEPAFDPNQHLGLTEPKSVTLLDFQQVESFNVPIARNRETSQLAFTSAFQILSNEGVKAMRQVIDNHRDLQSSNTRINRYLRGMAYSSKFVRAFNESPQVLAHLSRLAGMPLVPHYMQSSYAHTNLSADPSANKVVDSWHVDSCPFVLITVCSSMDGMEGGTLQAVKRKGLAEAKALVDQTQNNVAKADMMEVDYVSQGYGIFMQGCEILHRVTPVTRAKEARISVVNSYMPANVFCVDRTAPGSYLLGIDGGSTFAEAPYEFSRGRAFRALHQLRHFVNSPYQTDRDSLAAQLQITVDELQYVLDILRGKKTDLLGFIKEGAPSPKDGQKSSEETKTDHAEKEAVALRPRFAPSKL